MYIYETHLHTLPVSKCADTRVRETVEFYKRAGYDGVFITNHFLDGNIGIEDEKPYEERINFFFRDYEEGVEVGKEIGIDVFCGVETSHGGTDFLIYGLDKEWYLAHPELESMKKEHQLILMMESGALVIQAHPFREGGHIDYIRLLPRHVHGVEIYNGCRGDFENNLAEYYAKSYGLIPFAGTDNHRGEAQRYFGGMESETPIIDELDFVEKVKKGEMTPFRREMGK